MTGAHSCGGRLALLSLPALRLLQEAERFNAVQHPEENPGLKTQDLPNGVQVENLIPNQILGVVELY
jgi:hypothetical protein